MQPEMELTSTRDEIGKGISVRTEVYALDEFYSTTPLAGRSDVKARRKVGAINDTQDLEGTLRKLAPGAGAYYVQSVAGRDVIDRDVFHIQPKGQKLEVESMRGQATTGAQSPAQAVASPAASVEQSSAQSINATTETIRATKELLREVQPQTPATPALSATEIQRMIADGIREGLAQQQQHTQAAPPAKSLVEQAREIKESAEVLGITGGRQQSGDPFETYLTFHERLLAASEKINPNGEGRSGWGNAVGIVKDLVGIGKEVAPLAMAIISGGRAQAMAASMGMADAATPAEAQPLATPAQPQPTQPQASNEPQNENEAFALIAYIAVNDLIKNKRVGRTADLIEDMAARFPALVPMVNQFCTMEPEAALATLGQFTGRNDLLTFRHAREWVLDLIEELTPEDDSEGDEGGGSEQAQADTPNIIQMADARAS